MTENNARQNVIDTIEHYKVVKELQEEIAAKDKELDRHHMEFAEAAVASEKEIERLKGLVKSKIHCGQPDCKPCNDLWEIYKKENNL